MKQTREQGDNANPLTTEYKRTAKEGAAWEAFAARRSDSAPTPHLKVDPNGGTPRLTFEHPDRGLAAALLMNALGTTDANFFEGLLKQVANAATVGQNLDEANINFMLSIVTGIQPKDQVECMLATQMAAVHMATMTFARRLANVDNIPQQDSAERAFNKLTKTFCAQVEALKRYRTGGEQRVVVQHVNVNGGGQAIVGNVSQGGGRGRKNDG